MTAVENVAMPLMFRGMEKRKREEAARALLKRVGLSHRMFHYPGQMSGGQQQRAGIARAFVTKPQVVFADEPTGNLDSRTTEEIMKMIMGFARKYEETIILVTHDPGMARFADRIVTLKDGNIIGDERKEKEVNRYKGWKRLGVIMLAVMLAAGMPGKAAAAAVLPAEADAGKMQPELLEKERTAEGTGTQTGENGRTETDTADVRTPSGPEEDVPEKKRSA